MNSLKLFKPLWWVVHAAAIAGMSWLGSFMQLGGG